MTFSIVACDLAAREWGVAVASRFLAVGAIVPWARAEAGAVATQALAEASFGPRALELLRHGRSARDAGAELLGADEGRERRQLAIVDRHGHAFTHTGAECLEWAGGRRGDGYAVQGNILAGQRVVDAMAEAFESAQGSLAARLLAALRAGDAAGGDRRGRQSAALLVAKERGGYGGTLDRMVDLRVDDHPDPCAELARLLGAWRLTFTKPAGPGLPIEGRVKAEVSRALRRLGHLGPREPLTSAAFTRFLHTENFEERELPGMRIDPDVLAWLKAQAKARAPRDGG